MFPSLRRWEKAVISGSLVIRRDKESVKDVPQLDDSQQIRR